MTNGLRNRHNKLALTYHSAKDFLAQSICVQLPLKPQHNIAPLHNTILWPSQTPPQTALWRTLRSFSSQSKLFPFSFQEMIIWDHRKRQYQRKVGDSVDQFPLSAPPTHRGRVHKDPYYLPRRQEWNVLQADCRRVLFGTNTVYSQCTTLVRFCWRSVHTAIIISTPLYVLNKYGNATRSESTAGNAEYKLLIMKSEK